MLEPCVNQAAGLQTLGLRHTVRLTAMVSHGRQQGELPLLWGLCARWIDRGLTVVVLDGHVRESSTNAGLAQLLDDPLSRVAEDAANQSWLVLPAANGLQRLHAPDLLATSLAEVFKDFDVVLIYADASELATLLKGSSMAPLVVVSPAPEAALSAYAALKQLLLYGHLHPTVANIVPEQIAMPSRLETPSVLSLMQCATTFLGYCVTPHRVIASSQADQPHHDLDRLALQLFENALPLQQCGRERVH